MIMQASYNPILLSNSSKFNVALEKQFTTSILVLRKTNWKYVVLLSLYGLRICFLKNLKCCSYNYILGE